MYIFVLSFFVDDHGSEFHEDLFNKSSTRPSEQICFFRGPPRLDFPKCFKSVLWFMNSSRFSISREEITHVPIPMSIYVCVVSFFLNCREDMGRHHPLTKVVNLSRFACSKTGFRFLWDAPGTLSIGWFQIFTWKMVGNHQTSIKNWLFGVPGISYWMNYGKTLNNFTWGRWERENID